MFTSARLPHPATTKIDPNPQGVIATGSWIYGDTWRIIPIRFFRTQEEVVDAAKRALYSLRMLHSVEAELGHYANVLEDQLVQVPVYGLNGLSEEVWKENLPHLTRRNARVY
jgi:hypothetical protein